MKRLKQVISMTALIMGMLTIGIAVAQAEIILHAASQFDEKHPYTQSMMKFEELVNKYQSIEKVKVVYHLNSELGNEPDYFRAMSRGEGVDVAVVSPGHTAKRVPLSTALEIPLLFRDIKHRDLALNSGIFKDLEQQFIKRAKARVLGYAGGGIRSLITNRSVDTMEKLKGLKIRVQGAPVWSKLFLGLETRPSVLAYSEVYSAIQTGVVEGLENDPLGFTIKHFYEVAPNFTLTQHQVTVRPIFISEKAYQSLPPEVQKAALKAGREAGEFGTALEAKNGTIALKKLADQKLANVMPFKEMDALRAQAMPILKEYAKSIGAMEILKAVQDMK